MLESDGDKPLEGQVTVDIPRVPRDLPDPRDASDPRATLLAHALLHVAGHASVQSEPRTLVDIWGPRRAALLPQHLDVDPAACDIRASYRLSTTQKTRTSQDVFIRIM